MRLNPARAGQKDQSVLCRKMKAVYFKNDKEPINALRGRNAVYIAQ
jgi:hypothetical protein